MKNIFRLVILRPVALFLLVLNLLSCAKSGEPSPDDAGGCAVRVQVPVTAHSLGAADILAAHKLFSSNRIDNRSFRYFRYQRAPFATQFPPYTTYDEQFVAVEEYANGLRVFTAISNFIFWNGTFHHRSGKPTAGTSLSNSPALTVGEVGSLFAASVKKFEPSAPGSANQCSTAELGYYNINAGTGNAPENLVRVWKVTREKAEYPYAYYEDNGGKLIYYDNGVRTFR